MREVWVVEQGDMVQAVRIDSASAGAVRDQFMAGWPGESFRVVRYVPAPTKKPKAKKGTR